jgi:hypothetical protein
MAMKLRRWFEWIAFAASSGIVLYAVSAAFIYLFGFGIDEDCRKARGTSADNERGVLAEAQARSCALIGLHLSGESGDVVLVYYEPRNNKDTPILRWTDAQNLSIDLGEVNWLTPQISHLGRVKISYTYSGAEPSLE